jgi:hypothetical protein
MHYTFTRVICVNYVAYFVDKLYHSNKKTKVVVEISSNILIAILESNNFCKIFMKFYVQTYKEEKSIMTKRGSTG